MPEISPNPLSLTPIGCAHTPWRRGHCPKNMNAARTAGETAWFEIAAPYRPGLTGLQRTTHVIALGWFGYADRTVLVLKPAHLTTETGCFALRSPARPNPIALSIAKIMRLDVTTGRIDLDALDWFDGTQLLDVKPYYPSTDMLPDARITEPD